MAPRPCRERKDFFFPVLSLSPLARTKIASMSEQRSDGSATVAVLSTALVSLESAGQNDENSQERGQ